MTSKIKGLFISIRQIIKFAQSTGKVIAPTEIIELRLSICRACEYLTGSKCVHCGCSMPIKVGLQAAECPIGKWIGCLI